MVEFGPKGNRKRTTAHRAVYEHLTQTKLGKLTLDHVCRVRHCVNSDHMRPLTRQENSADHANPWPRRRQGG